MSVKNEEKTLLIMVGSECNNNCSMCSVNGKNKIKSESTKNLKKIITEKSDTYQKIEFTGGEPTIRNDFYELLGLANKIGYRQVAVSSNLRLFSYPKHAKRAAENGLDLATTSLHGTEEIHNAITRTPNSYEQTIKGIENLKQEGVNISVNTVITALNIGNVFEMKKIIGKLNVNWSFLDLIPEGLERGVYDDLKASYSEISTVFSNLIESNKNFSLFTFFDYPYCIFSKNLINNPKVNFIAARERSTDFENDGGFSTGRVINENGVYIDNHKERTSFCKKCEYGNICGGVWRSYLDLEGEKEIKSIAKKNNLIIDK